MAPAYQVSVLQCRSKVKLDLDSFNLNVGGQQPVGEEVAVVVVLCRLHFSGKTTLTLNSEVGC